MPPPSIRRPAGTPGCSGNRSIPLNRFPALDGGDLQWRTALGEASLLVQGYPRSFSAVT